jgi:hypothetical protein
MSRAYLPSLNRILSNDTFLIIQITSQKYQNVWARTTRLTRAVVAAINGATGEAELAALAALAARMPNAEVATCDCHAEPAASLELGLVTGPGGRDKAGAGNCASRFGPCCCCCPLRGGTTNKGGG